MQLTYVSSIVVILALFVVLLFVKPRPLIDFLSRERSADVFECQGLLQKYRYLESYVRTNGYADDAADYQKQTLDAYRNSVDDFSKSEQDAIIRLLSAYPTLMQFHWRFIKINSRMDMGMPYTLGSYVILPEHLVTSITSGLHLERCAETLAHELIHILQRYNQNKFDDFYERNWNFRRGSVAIPKVIQDRLVTNPDSVSVNWVLLEAGQTWWFCLQLDHNLNLVTRAYKLKSSGPDDYAVTGESTDIRAFAHLFHGVSHLSSPNEIFAYRYAKSLLT